MASGKKGEYMGWDKSSDVDCDVGLGLKMQIQQWQQQQEKMMMRSSGTYTGLLRRMHLIGFGFNDNDSSGGDNYIVWFGLVFLDEHGSMSLPCPSGDTSSTASVAFTADQRQELERQTIIYKYMLASMPVPPQLLLPLSKYPTTTAASSTTASGGRGGGDPEPWRCRRTDGKKWRCSRDVAPDQKYCERHSHKGRPSARSRKPVESILSPPTPPTSASSALHFSSPLLQYSLLPNPRFALFPIFIFPLVTSIFCVFCFVLVFVCSSKSLFYFFFWGLWVFHCFVGGQTLFHSVLNYLFFCVSLGGGFFHCFVGGQTLNPVKCTAANSIHGI